MFFTKCTNCDKLHLCTYHDRSDWILPQNKINEMICQAIIPIIPEDPQLKELFLKWSTLKHSERVVIDDKIEENCINLCLPLKEAFMHWELIQETEGAPGFDPGLFSFSCDSNLKEELRRVMYKFDNIIGSVLSGITSCTETQSEPNMLDISSDELSASESKESLGPVPRLHQKSASMGNLLIY